MKAFFVLLGLMAGSAMAQEPSPPVSDFSKREIGLQVGHALKYNGAEEFGMGGMGLRLQWLERLGPYLSLGLEAALYRHAGSTFFVRLPDHNFIITDKPLFQLGGVWRIEVTRSRVRPAFLLGVAWHKGRFNRFAFSAGAEVAVRTWEGALLVLDARFHNEADLEEYYRTLGLGLRMAW